MKTLLKRWATPALLLLLGLGWLIWWRAGVPIARMVAARDGAALVRLGKGKITEPAAFLDHRASELLLLASVAVALWLAIQGLHRLLRSRAWSQSVRGLVLGVSIFAALNCWVQIASGTALFWLPFFNPRSVDNVAQYQIKKHMLAEHTAKQRAVLLGNSQTRASIKEEVLNDLLAPHLWTTELHQPGCNGFDTWLIVDDLRAQPFDVAIIYVSEIYIYGRENGGVAPRFLRLRDLPRLNAMHGWPELGSGLMREGIAGSLCPLYRLNSSLSQRALGGFVAELPQQRFDESQAAARTAPVTNLGAGFQRGASAEFQKRGLEAALTALAQKRCAVLLIAGGVNPKLRESEDPAVVVELNDWLQTLPSRWPGTVALIPESSFFHATEADYVDLVHFNEEAQERFSRALAAYLLERGLVAK